ncbi:MAG TPA: ferredoxin [Actinobacteria bacterium]|nr:ferredoxin [Actinomycetota bacterium]
MQNNKIHIEIEPIGKRFNLNRPANMLDAIRNAGIEIKSVCSGKGTCGKCRIIITEGSIPPPTDSENKALTKDEISHGVRLACQHEFKEKTSVYIPASSLSEEQKLQISGQEKRIEAEPVVKKYFLKLERATLEDVKADFNRIKDSLLAVYSVKADSIDFEVLKRMPEIIRKNKWEITVTVRKNEIVNIEAGDTSGRNYGIAIDLGTTKIAALLVDLINGNTIDKKGVMNPQISYGEDVMSRINFASESAENLTKINKAVTDSINSLVKELCEKNDLKSGEISEITLVGNTAMHHLFLGLPVKQLGLSPFPALTNDFLEIKARELGLDISTGGYVYLIPVVAGFIGSDLIAMVLATELYKMEGNCIGIDIGTNTEIALVSKGRLYSVSTASGPAFEGAHIRYGMRAAPGAIERVIIDSNDCRPRIQTIEDKEPAGICGSGILDAVAELLKAGIINSHGKFDKENRCVCVDSSGNVQYILLPDYHDKNGRNCPPEDLISINQKDIVEIQLAKGAMRTGIEILLEHAGIDFNDIDKIIIAGAFGSYIDPKNVINIGMFPNVSLRKISQVGNAASIGAKMVLVSEKQRKIAEDIGRKIQYLELTVFPSFSDHFAQSVQFPKSEEII